MESIGGEGKKTSVSISGVEFFCKEELLFFGGESCGGKRKKQRKEGLSYEGSISTLLNFLEKRSRGRQGGVDWRKKRLPES